MTDQGTIKMRNPRRPDEPLIEVRAGYPTAYQLESARPQGFAASTSAIPAKQSTVTIPISGTQRMCKVSIDGASIFVVNSSGTGSVVNSLTERVDKTFQVAVHPNPAQPYPTDLPTPPIVSPFARGGINHKYQRLYVPASFYTEVRFPQWGGFFVAVVDIDPNSTDYLKTISWIDCGWLPEEIGFSQDEETGVIANYNQGTVTIFKTADHSILAPEVDGFDGAGAGPGGPCARSVRCAKVPGIGNRAFMTLSDTLPLPGCAVFDLDDPAFTRTNITDPAFGFIDGVAITTDPSRVLLVDASNNSLRVVRIDGATPSIERSIALPGGHAYFGAIAAIGAHDTCLIATGRPEPSGAPSGTSLVQVNYETGVVTQNPTNLPADTWELAIAEYGTPAVPHVVSCASSGFVAISPLTFPGA
ncbi:hypothetical protein [Sinorhizobium meliloti]|uniref:hypothetical protein n=1 Tax=Rhizobium meliloti TaxID=382 RepID=UPI0012BC2484|nr:hypothetical protein [Sinorhizobium meliloti]UFX12251.1 hypothetical protein SmelRRI128_25950 [Sinorhizobium meliloti]